MSSDQQTRSEPILEVVLFFSLTLGMSFLVFWGPLALFQIPAISFVDNVSGPGWAIALFILGGFVPSLAAVLLTGIREGRAGLKLLWQRMTQFKIGWRWYLAAFLLVLFGSVFQILLLRVSGHSFDLKLFLIQLPSAIPLIIIGPLSEEIGWRGYAQDRLQARWTPLVSGVIVGLVWALWHLPLFLIPGTAQHELHIPYLGFFFGVTSLSVLFAWLHDHTGASIWTAVFFHWIYTYAGQVIASGATRNGLYNWLEYSPYFVAALIIALFWQREKSSSPLIARNMQDVFGR